MPVYIPTNYVKVEEWDTDLELYSCFSIPSPVGDFAVKPLSIGVFALLETMDSRYIKDCENSELIDLWRVLYINELRDKCAFDLYQWIEQGGIGNTIRFSDPETLLKWDVDVIQWGMENFPPDQWTIENQIRINQIIQTCFLGFRMIPGGKEVKGGILYGAETISSIIVNMCKPLQKSCDDIFWNVPVVLLGHAMAALSKANGQKCVQRPPDPRDMELKMQQGRERAAKGLLHPWQILDPIWCELEKEQLEANPEIAAEQNELKEILKDHQRKRIPFKVYYDLMYERYPEILDTVKNG